MRLGDMTVRDLVTHCIHMSKTFKISGNDGKCEHCMMHIHKGEDITSIYCILRNNLSISGDNSFIVINAKTQLDTEKGGILTAPGKDPQHVPTTSTLEGV